MNYQLLLLLSLAFGSIFPSEENCRQIHVVPYTTKRGKVDPFGLTGLVSDHFKRLGFEIVGGPLSSNKPDCQYYQCTLYHTENYWKFKRDSVCLTISNREEKLIGRYCGMSGTTALTFQSGYETATVNALNTINQSHFSP